MSTHTTHYPLDPAAILAQVWLGNDGRTWASVYLGDALTITCVANQIDRMHPQVFTRRLRELADEIDRRCDQIRDEQAHVGQLVEA